MDNDALNPLRTALEWNREGRAVALATVVETWGSAPRRPGSHMVVDAEGAFAGSVSGGCVEVAVADEARGVIEKGRFRDLSYGVADADAWAVGLACGGTVRIAVAPIGKGPGGVHPALLERALAATTEGAVVLAYDLVDGGVAAAAARSDVSDDAVARVLRSDRGEIVEADGREVFLRPYNAPVRIVLIGAVHIAQSLAALARVVGFRTVVVDPREAFARVDRFPEVELILEWPDEGMARVDVDARTAVVALTHDPKLDDPALRSALAGPAFYVGALGSRRTHEKRRARLLEAGVGEADVARIHAPVGLDLGGRAPEEIALSILAEIVGVLRGGGAVRGG